MKFNKNDEYYTLPETVQDLINTIRLSRERVIWCPFDTCDSEIVKVLKLNGYQVYYSHIQDGKDFLTCDPPPNVDMIISNPPFSLKNKIMDRLYEFDFPFILLFGLQSLSVSGFVNRLSNFNDIYFIVPSKRVKFKDVNGNIKCPSFQSVWITNMGISNYFIRKENI